MLLRIYQGVAKTISGAPPPMLQRPKDGNCELERRSAAQECTCNYHERLGICLHMEGGKIDKCGGPPEGF